MRFSDRRHAGRVLADNLMEYAGRGADVVVLGLVRGGAPVGVEVARRLDAPLDVLVVRKLGLPRAPELAFGAVGPHGVRILNPDVADRLDPMTIATVVQRESGELHRREQRFRADRPAPDLAGRITVIVDDGLATGATARAAVAVVRKLGAASVVVAVPVGSPEAVAALRSIADRVVCPVCPARFSAVGRYYDDFTQVTDDEVICLLAS